MGAPRLLAPDGGVVQLERRDGLLLAYLAIEGPVARARLLTLLWPGEDSPLVRNRLRQRLFALKRKLGVEATQGQHTMALGNDILWEGFDPGSGDAAFLGDDDHSDLQELSLWVQSQRTQLRMLGREILARRSAELEEQGQLSEAIVEAERLLLLDPLREQAHRQLMRLHYLRGDRAAALLAFDRCESCLKDEVGARPSAETLALLETIESEVGAPARAAQRELPASVQRPPRLVGRKRELTLLEQAWAAGHVAALVGEAGMGKSRLLHEFMHGRAGVVRAAGRPGDANVPFATLARLLRAVGELADPGPARLDERTRQEIARLLPEWAPTPVHPGEGQRMRLWRAVLAFLQHTAIQGLVVDDLHFADAASLEMLQSLIDSEAEPVPGTGLRWLVALRPAEADTRLHQFQQGVAETGRLSPIALGPLEELALAELVDDLALPGVSGSALAPFLRRRTGGNPLFLLETIKQAWVDGSLGLLAEGRGAPRPLSVGQLIEARVARLSRDALALARVAAIAGIDFDIALAEHALGTTAIRLSDALQELESAQVMSGTRFAHDLVYESVLRSVPLAIAVHTHAQVARWLEQHAGEAARIAHHWVQAEAAPRAIPHLMRAAEESTRRTGLAEARRFLEQAASLSAQAGLPREEFDALQALHENYTRDDPGPEHERLVQRLVALAQTPHQRVRAELTRANLSRRRLLPAPASTLLELLDRAVALDDSDLIVSAVNMLISTLLPSGQATLAAQLLSRHEHRYALKPNNLADFHGDLATTFGSLDRFEEALKHVDAGMALYRSHGAMDEVMTAMGNRGRMLRMQGRMQTAWELACEMDLWHASSAPNTRAWLTSRVGAAEAARDLSRYDDAMQAIDRNRADIDKHVGLYGPQLPVVQAAVWLALGQAARARDALDATPAEALAQAPDWLRARHALARLRVNVRLRAGAGAEHPTGEDLAALDRAAALAPREVRRAAWFECELQRAAWVEARAGIELARSIEVVATAQGMLGYARTALLRAAQRQLDDGRPDLALQALQGADALGVQRFPGASAAEPVAAASIEEIEAELVACQVLLAVPASGAAARLARATERLHRIARDHVREEFRDSFLHRNPANRALLALAARTALQS